MCAYSKSQLRALADNGLGAELPPPPKPRKNDEMKMQMEVVSWWSQAHRELGVPEMLLWHTPNGSVYGGSKENRQRIGAMMKRMGCREGVPDLFVAVPRLQIATKGSSGLFVEMKTPKGVISPEQCIMLAALEVQGFKTTVCRTVEDAKRVITEYLK